jgi:hyperosmotically inducible protein
VITTKLKSALLADAEIKGTDVSVDTKQGQVTLTGSVKSEAQKDRIQKIAKGIDGVKDVQDKLTVKQ